MEMLKKFKKKIVPLVLAVVIFATSVVSGPASLTAQAASVVVSTETSVEFVMMLYNIFETISIASGIKDGLDDYDSGMSLFEAFIGFIDSLAYDPFERFTIYGPDGSVMTQEDMDALIEAAMGNGKLKVRPDKKAFAKYRIIDGTASPSQSPDPSSSPDPDDKYVNPFTDLQGMFVGANLVAAGADFLSSVQNNAVPEVDPAEYYSAGDGSFLGSVPVDSDGKFVYRGKYGPTNSMYKTYSFIIYTSLDRCAAYLNNNTLYFGALNSSGKLSPLQVWFDGYSFDNARPVSGRTGISYMYFGNETYSFNFPFFESAEDANNYLNTGVFNGCLNDIPYDYHSMTAAAPDTLEYEAGSCKGSCYE